MASPRESCRRRRICSIAIRTWPRAATTSTSIIPRRGERPTMVPSRAFPCRRSTTPRDGQLGGIAAIDGRPVAVLGDDVTVLSGSSSLTGQIKKDRIEHYAIEHGFPIVFLGEAGGGRLPDQLGAEGFGIAINA